MTREKELLVLINHLRTELRYKYDEYKLHSDIGFINDYQKFLTLEDELREYIKEYNSIKFVKSE